MIAPREQGIARRRTHSARCVGVGKPHSLRSQLVDVRRWDLTARWIVALKITVAEIVGEDDQNIGLRMLTGRETNER